MLNATSHNHALIYKRNARDRKRGIPTEEMEEPREAMDEYCTWCKL